MDQISGRSAVIAVNAAYLSTTIAVKRNITDNDIKTEEETRPILGQLLVASASFDYQLVNQDPPGAPPRRSVWSLPLPEPGIYRHSS